MGTGATGPVCVERIGGETMAGWSERGAAALSILIGVLVGLGGLGLGAGLVVAGVIDPLPDAAPTTTITAADRINLLDCSGGLPVDTVFDGDTVFAVGTDATGAWIAVRRPGDARAVGWLPASNLDPDGNLDALPVRSCDPSDDIVGMPTELVIRSSTTLPSPAPTEPPPYTTEPPTATTEPPTDTTEAPPDTTEPPTDTEPPVLLDPLVLPNLIFPETCTPPSEYDTEASAYLTVESGTEPVTATLTWRYLPTDTYDESGELSVTVLPDPTSTLLIGAVRGLPDPYPPPISGPPTPAIIEFEWIVRDEAGNTSRAVVTADLGRCL